MAEWLRRLALELLAPLRCGSGSNPMRDSCQLVTECFVVVVAVFLLLFIHQINNKHFARLISNNVINVIRGQSIVDLSFCLLYSLTHLTPA